MQAMGDWWNPLTWFDGDSGSASNDFPTSGAIDWNLGWNTDYQTPGMSDSDVKSWTDYVGSGGSLVPGWYPNYVTNTGTVPGGTTTTSSDFDLGDIFGGITSALQGIGGVFNTGLQAYANVQQLINAQNPQDKIVRPPGSNMVYIQRGTELIPLNTAYPQIFGSAQFQQAQQQDMFNNIFKFGALALGGVLLFKLVDKKK